MAENDYIKIPGKLSLTFKASEIELLQVGLIGTHIHRILNQVAISIIQVHDEVARPDGDEPAIKFIPQTFNREDALIKARLTGFREGSVEMDIAAVAAAVFSQPGAVAILTNLLSSTIWAIGTYAARIPNIRVTWHSAARRDDIYDLLVRPEAGRRKLRPKIEKFVELLAESSKGGHLRLKTEDIDFEIHFNPPSVPADNAKPKN